MKIFRKLSDHTKYRFLEIIPGFMVWSTFILALIFTFLKPLWVIYFIIVFDLYWLVRISYLAIYLIISYQRFRQSMKINWLEKCQTIPRWRDTYHLIFIPTYKEGIEVLRTSFDSLTKINFPLDRLIVVFAGEERDKENFLHIADQIQKQFGHRFFKLLVTVHPKDISGEIAAKGSNIAWAGRKAKELIDELKIPYENVIVSSFDADTCVHPQYFSYLTYQYLTNPKATRTSYQPVALYNNNVWDSPAFTRVVSYSTTFWILTELLRPERMFTFSSHSMSFKALVDVDFWQNDIVTEDSRICLQGLVRYDGDYQVMPMYIPLSMDVVMANTFWKTIKAQYIQVRRWAYGVENFPFMVWNFWGNKKIPFLTKFRYIFNQLEGVYSWATSPILILVLGRLPIWLANRQEHVSAIAQNAPNILQWLMTIAMIGIFVSAILGTTLLPPRPRKYKKIKLLFMIVQWVLLPVTLIIFGSIPATEAQTRLMLGKYLGFHVTAKARK